MMDVFVVAVIFEVDDFFSEPGIGDEYCYDHDISHGYRRLEQEDSSGAFRYFWWKVQKPKKKTCVFSELSDTG